MSDKLPDPKGLDRLADWLEDHGYPLGPGVVEGWVKFLRREAKIARTAIPRERGRDV